jgi:hypothetical protein
MVYSGVVVPDGSGILVPTGVRGGIPAGISVLAATPTLAARVRFFLGLLAAAAPKVTPVPVGPGMPGIVREGVVTKSGIAELLATDKPVSDNAGESREIVEIVTSVFDRRCVLLFVVEEVRKPNPEGTALLSLVASAAS